MICVRCGKKLKLRNDGMRRCGKGCSEIMGVELRIAKMPPQKQFQSIVECQSTFKLSLKPTWKMSDA